MRFYCLLTASLFFVLPVFTAAQATEGCPADGEALSVSGTIDVLTTDEKEWTIDTKLHPTPSCQIDYVVGKLPAPQGCTQGAQFKASGTVIADFLTGLMATEVSCE